MCSPPRIAIIGAGGIARAHAAGFAAIPDLCTVVAVAEPDTTRVHTIHSMFGPDVRIVTDYHELLADPDIDAVDILLPHDLHMPATCDAAAAGKHVLVEKVMARSIAECDRMIAACEQANVTLTVCHDRRYHPGWLALKQLIDEDALGNLFFCKLSHNQDVAPPEGHWIRSRERLGGGAIMSCLTHQIDALRWFAGEVDSLTCMTRSIPERMEGETVGVIAARMRSGALAELSINWWTGINNTAHGLYYELVHLCGTRGEAYWKCGACGQDAAMVHLHKNADPVAVTRYGDEALGDFVPVPLADGSGHLNCLREWAHMLRGEPHHVSTTGRDSRATVEVAEAALRAEQTGHFVSLPLEPLPA